jgi:20S proteasome subunit beta 4
VATYIYKLQVTLNRITNHVTKYRYYCLSILDKHHHPDISFEQGMKILRMCTDELQRRLPIDFKGMTVKVVKKDGIVDLEYDTSKQVLAA